MIGRRFLCLGMAAAMGLGMATGTARAQGQAQGQAQGNELVVFAAASMKNALDEAAAGWAKETGKPAPKISYAASSVLAKQLEQGAPADLFLSADLEWMRYVEERGLVRPDTVSTLLVNRIVLIAPADSPLRLALQPGVDLASALGDGRLAMGQVDSVPAGKYGKAALEKLGVWETVKDKLAQAENVRAALLLVSRGEAPLGIVYKTDAAADPKVRIVATFPEETHPPIVYPVALTKEARLPAASAFLTYLQGLKARRAFEKQGFTRLYKPAGGSGRP